MNSTQIGNSAVAFLLLMKPFI